MIRPSTPSAVVDSSADGASVWGGAISVLVEDSSNACDGPEADGLVKMSLPLALLSTGTAARGITAGLGGSSGGKTVALTCPVCERFSDTPFSVASSATSGGGCEEDAEVVGAAGVEEGRVGALIEGGDIESSLETGNGGRGRLVFVALLCGGTAGG